MINSKPANSSYNSGNYIPRNKDKVLKLNNEGGVYFRSSWEKKIMVWLDQKEEVVSWGAECLEIPYQMTHMIDGELKLKSHRYYPDFVYAIKLPDGRMRQVVVEVKPLKEYNMVIALQEGKLQVPEKGMKKLKSFEYDLKMAHKNKNKWETMISWCEIKGFDFLIVTEQNLNKFNV
jgi:hypothetical protein